MSHPGSRVGRARDPAPVRRNPFGTVTRVDIRRILLAFAIFLLVSAMLGSLGGGTRRSERADKPPEQRVTAPPRQIDGELPLDRTVRARPGDLVKVVVSNETYDTAEIVDLGLEAPVDQDLDGTLEFLAREPGSYPVTLRIADRPVGRVVVLAPK